MTAIPSFPSTCFAIIALGVFSIASGCKDQEVPKTQSGEPVPFDHLATLPSDHPPIAADAGQGQGKANPPARSQSVLTARSIKVTVKLSPALADKTAPDDSVFIFARAAQGPKMPLAIVRKQVKDLPVTVTLDDSMAMVPDMKMSSFPELVIGARVSKSGNAIPVPGDLQGYAPAMKDSTANPVVVIESVVGGAAAHNTGHASAGNKKAQLNISADVKAKWKTVELSIASNSLPARKISIPIGSRIDVGSSGLVVQVVAYVPAFQSNAGMITSASNNPDNPAVLVELRNKDKLLGEGWVFQKHPGYNSFTSDALQLQLLSASASEGG